MKPLCSGTEKWVRYIEVSIIKKFKKGLIPQKILSLDVHNRFRYPRWFQTGVFDISSFQILAWPWQTKTRCFPFEGSYYVEVIPPECEVTLRAQGFMPPQLGKLPTRGNTKKLCMRYFDIVSPVLKDRFMIDSFHIFWPHFSKNANLQNMGGESTNITWLEYLLLGTFEWHWNWLNIKNFLKFNFS